MAPKDTVGLVIALAWPAGIIASFDMASLDMASLDMASWDVAIYVVASLDVAIYT